MQQLEFFEIPSPCINVCESGANGFCKGCFRSREERLHWNKLEPNVKRKIVKACALRKRRAERATLNQQSTDQGSDQKELF